MSNAYRAVVQSGGGAAVGDATAADVLTGKTFSGAVGTGVSGTMPNNGAVTQTIGAGGTYTIPQGYHNGSGSVTALGLGYDYATIVSGTPYAFTLASADIGTLIIGGTDGAVEYTVSGDTVTAKSHKGTDHTSGLTVTKSGTTLTVAQSIAGSFYCTIAYA